MLEVKPPKYQINADENIKNTKNQATGKIDEAVDIIVKNIL